MYRLVSVFLLLFPSLVQGEQPIRIAVFEGNGVGKSAGDLIAALEQGGGDRVEVSRISAEQIQSDGLSGFQVLIHPGGSGSKQGKALGEPGREAVRQFIRDGGGFLGVCAGAYLATNDYTWSLNLVDAKVVDRLHWARGKGSVTIRLARPASELFDHDGEQLDIYYGQGPLLARREWDDADVPDYESLAIYETEIVKNGASKGIMKGTSAIVRCRYGSGRVLCFSPHPELTAGLEHLIPIAVDWLSGDPKASDSKASDSKASDSKVVDSGTDPSGETLEKN